MASRKEQKQALRAERLKREQEAAAAERRRRLLGYGAAGVLGTAALVAIVVVIVSSGGSGDTGSKPTESGFPSGSIPDQVLAELDPAAKAAKCEVKRNLQIEGSSHVSDAVEYKTNPPTSGDHFEIPAEDGPYTRAPRKETLVHSLEHGRIIIWFKPNASNDLKGKLKALFDEQPRHVILAPNETNMPYEVAASAWGNLLGCKKANDKSFDAIRAFRDELVDQGPEQVP
jgi:Protein of unknown function (DUF3105)